MNPVLAPDRPMTLPNLISVFRLFLVPIIAWLIIGQDYLLAFWLFLLAGISDAVDGIIARHFASTSKLGGYLDPAADKALMVTVFLCLAMLGLLPGWLIILVVGRDVLIVSAVVLSSMLRKPVVMNPLIVSKANTAAQIILIGFVMGALAYGISSTAVDEMELLLIYLVAGLTSISTLAYLVDWIRHLADPHLPCLDDDSLDDETLDKGLSV